jgi:hypothetical protein
VPCYYVVHSAIEYMFTKDAGKFVERSAVKRVFTYEREGA